VAIKKYKSNKSDQLVLESASCREIVHEVMNFGVGQRQILEIIKLLSMELDNVNMMKAITHIIEDKLDNEIISETTTILT